MGNLNDLQKIQLEILQEFSTATKRENLAWFAMFGTLLGAVRSKGFIPWDDDIDVAMPRADYDKLRLSAGWFDGPYFLQTPQNDPAGAPRFMRLRRSDTTVMAGFPNGLTRGGHMGAYIDILPLDDVPGARQARSLHCAAMRIQKQMLACAALDESSGAELPDWKAEHCYGNGGIAGCYSMVSERYEQVLSRYARTPYVAIPVLKGMRGCRVFDKAWFKSQEPVEFEGIAIPAPSSRMEVLIASYPEGLLEPEASELAPKHEEGSRIVDIGRPYTEYVKRYTDMMEGIEGKRVYLFGAGDSMRIWLERYSKGLDIACAFDNSEPKWGTAAYGIPVRKPDELPKLMDSRSRLIIASLYHREIGAQLESMGICDYYVFIDGWNYGKRDD